MIAALAMLSLGKLPMPARPAGGAARARSARAAGRAASTATWAAASVCLPEAAAGGVAAAAAAAGACPLAVTGPQVALAASHILPAGGLFSPGATHRPHQAAAASQAEGVAPALRQLQSELQLADQAHLQDVFGAMVLSECIYKAVDVGTDRAAEAIQKLGAALPAHPHLFNVTWSPPGQPQRYIMAETPTALHVSLLGTKLAGDHLTNLDLRYQAMPLPGFKSGPTAANNADERGAMPAAHRGYARRAEEIPVEQMYRLATVKGKRLVLSGHSLGGAVATLCTIRLLAALPSEAGERVSCIGFATPPMGNAALTAAVEEAGWGERITNYVLPEDWVPGALALWASTHPTASVSKQHSAAGPAASPGSYPTAMAAHGCVC